MDASMLLAGPRGRRLCLALAAEMDDRISTGISELSSGRDPDTTVTIYLAWSSPEDGCSPEAAPLESIDELARELRALDGSGLEEGAFHRALRASVQAARYWQEPDEGDSLAGLPEIREALLPLARGVCATSEAHRWSAPAPAQQWTVRWHREGGADEDDPHGDVSRWARGTRSAEVAARAERPRDPRAPWTGEWWSIPLGLQQSVDHVPTALDLVEDEFGWCEATVTPVEGPSSTLEIAAAEDWVQLCREHPLEVTASRRHDWYRVTGRDCRWVIPDWEQVAQRWNAVHLTVSAYLTAATRALEVEDGIASVIGGWDPGTTYWLGGDVPVVTGEPQQWRYDPDAETWTPVS